VELLNLVSERFDPARSVPPEGAIAATNVGETMNTISSAAVNSLHTEEPTVTRQEWLQRVLFSGEVSRVAQHLALAIHSASGESGVLRASTRDLEKLTGWSRTAIAENLQSLDHIATIVWGRGRAKAAFRFPYAEDDEDDEYVEVITKEAKSELRSCAISEFGHACSHCGEMGAETIGPDARPWCLDRIIPGAVGGQYVANNVT
jgi:hypothetical protein